MAQIFPRYTNTLSRLTASAVVALAFAALWLGARIQRSPYVTDVRVAKDQPVPFSHAHHSGQLGIDCRYCHTTVERSAVAGVPSTDVCMGCHAEIWKDSPMLEPVRASLRSGLPIRWRRVHDLPDFAYFDHSLHVARGVGCSSCHGRIDRMPLTWQAEPLTMSFCLDCHRQPARHLRTEAELYDMSWTPPAEPTPAQLARAKQAGIETLESCSYCHR